jgi:hypothetical protein
MVNLVTAAKVVLSSSLYFLERDRSRGNQVLVITTELDCTIFRQK